MRAAHSHRFASYPTKEFKTYISPKNHRSIAIAKRLNMHNEGAGKHPVHGDDCEVYSVSKDDYRHAVEGRFGKSQWDSKGQNQELNPPL